jgi:hypothetical protein
MGCCKKKKKSSSSSKEKEKLVPDTTNNTNKSNLIEEELDEYDMLKDEFAKQLGELGFDVTKTFCSHVDYHPLVLLNELNPQDTEEHDHFLSKFKDGIYAIATPKENVNNALLQVVFNDKEKVVLEINRPTKVLIGLKNDQKKNSKDNIKNKDTKKLDKKSEKKKDEKKNSKKNKAKKVGPDDLIVYVPSCYLKDLIQAQQYQHLQKQEKGGEYAAPQTSDANSSPSHSISEKKKAAEQKAKQEHDKFYRQFTEKYLDNLFLNSNINLRQVALSGNLLHQNVPLKVIEAIELDKLNVEQSGGVYFPLGEFEAHR